jgi:hypothetical protein
VDREHKQRLVQPLGPLRRLDQRGFCCPLHERCSESVDAAPTGMAVADNNQRAKFRSPEPCTHTHEDSARKAHTHDRIRPHA